MNGKPVAELHAFDDLVDVGKIEVGMDALRVEVHRQGDAKYYAKFLDSCRHLHILFSTNYFEDREQSRRSLDTRASIGRTWRSSPPHSQLRKDWIFTEANNGVLASFRLFLFVSATVVIFFSFFIFKPITIHDFYSSFALSLFYLLSGIEIAAAG